MSVSRYIADIYIVLKLIIICGLHKGDTQLMNSGGKVGIDILRGFVQQKCVCKEDFSCWFGVLVDEA